MSPAPWLPDWRFPTPTLRAVQHAPEGTEIFLNNLLLETGHAGRRDDFSLQDWDEVPTPVPK